MGEAPASSFLFFQRFARTLFRQIAAAMPDLTYVSNEKKHQLKPNGIFGAPDLTVEIVSPGVRNTKRDAVDKFQLYERIGVTEYWLVDYIDRKIFMYGLIDGNYEEIEQSRVLPGIELPAETIFADIED